jgi:hypothetical protein
MTASQCWGVAKRLHGKHGFGEGHLSFGEKSSLGQPLMRDSRNQCLRVELLFWECSPQVGLYLLTYKATNAITFITKISQKERS